MGLSSLWGTVLNDGLPVQFLLTEALKIGLPFVFVFGGFLFYI
jgi:hypothetical protein